MTHEITRPMSHTPDLMRESRERAAAGDAHCIWLLSLIAQRDETIRELLGGA